jgi:DNA-directed RNA polymerase specialized sigma24 family protein
MKEPNTGDRPNSIEWMLQSTEVSDHALLEILTEFVYPDLLRFGRQLSLSSESSSRLAAAAVVMAVRSRHRFWNQTSLKAWLFYIFFQKVKPPKTWLFYLFELSPFRGVYRGQAGWRPISTDTQKRGARSGETIIENLDPDTRLPFMLAYGHGFGIQETAYILRSQLETVRAALDSARRSLYSLAYPHTPLPYGHAAFIASIHSLSTGPLPLDEQAILDRHLDECAGCRMYAQRLPGLEMQWAEELDSGIEPPEQRQSAQDQAIYQAASQIKGHRRGSLPIKEVVLVAVAAVLLVFFGSSAGVFEAYDARPTLTLTPYMTRTPLPSATPRPTIPPPAELEGVEGEDFFYFSFRAEETDTVASLAVRLDLEEDTIRYLNPGLSESNLAGQTVELIFKRSLGWLNPHPREAAPPLPLPLTASSSLEDIFERIKHNRSYWDSILIEMVYLSFGPQGYAGPTTDSARLQLTYLSPETTIMNYIFLDNSGGTTYTTLQNGEWVFLLEPPGIQGVHGLYAQSQYWVDERHILFESLPDGGHYRISGEDELVGRQVIMLDWTSQGGSNLQRFWVDALTGVILQVGVYSDEQDEFMTQVLSAAGVVFSPAFPAQNIFPPFVDYNTYLETFNSLIYEKDIDPIEAVIERVGKRPYIDKRDPFLTQLDLTTAPLTLQWPEDYRSQVEGNDTLSDAPVEVFAGNHLLGRVQLYRRDKLRTCVRSPDGLKVALTVERGMGSRLFWLSLDPLVLHPMIELSIGTDIGPDIAFSPDSQRLVFFSCGQACGLYLLDLKSGDTKLVYTKKGSPGENLEWSPDGRQVAFIGWDTAGDNKITLLDIETQEVIYLAKVGPDSPAPDWTRPYPRQGERSSYLFGSIPTGCRYPGP